MTIVKKHHQIKMNGIEFSATFNKTMWKFPNRKVNGIIFFSNANAKNFLRFKWTCFWKRCQLMKDEFIWCSLNLMDSVTATIDNQWNNEKRTVFLCVFKFCGDLMPRIVSSVFRHNIWIFWHDIWVRNFSHRNIKVKSVIKS